MAAAEYYFGSAGALNQDRPNPQALPPQQPYHQYNLQSQPQNNQQLQPYNTPPPSYSPHPPFQPQSYPIPPQPTQFPPPPSGPPPKNRPQPSTPYLNAPPTRPQAYAPQPRPQQNANGYLGAPLQPYRSHSQPPRVHFADGKTGSDYSDYSDSDSDSSRRRRHRRHHRHRRSSSSSLEREREHDRGRHDDRYDEERSRKHRSAHKSRDTFLGAGAGTIVGDLLMPGLGTAAGLLLGGYGGRKHAEKRSRSHAVTYGGEESHGKRGPGRGEGWDEESGTFRMGHAVR